VPPPRLVQNPMPANLPPALTSNPSGQRVEPLFFQTKFDNVDLSKLDGIARSAISEAVKSSLSRHLALSRDSIYVKLEEDVGMFTATAQISLTSNKLFEAIHGKLLKKRDDIKTDLLGTMGEIQDAHEVRKDAGKDVGEPAIDEAAPLEKLSAWQDDECSSALKNSAHMGDTSIEVWSAKCFVVGDLMILDDEVVRVKSTGSGVGLEWPLRHDHPSGIQAKVMATEYRWTKKSMSLNPHQREWFAYPVEDSVVSETQISIAKEHNSDLEMMVTRRIIRESTEQELQWQVSDGLFSKKAAGGRGHRKRRRVQATEDKSSATSLPKTAKTGKGKGREGEESKTKKAKNRIMQGNNDGSSKDGARTLHTTMPQLVVVVGTLSFFF